MRKKRRGERLNKRRKYATEKEVEIPLQRRPTPLIRFLKVGQSITYSERQYIPYSHKKDREIVTGTIEYLCARYAVIKDDKGRPHTFTATDVFTGDVQIEGMQKRRNPLAEVLGLKEDG
jgi:hypothetical protein